MINKNQFANFFGYNDLGNQSALDFRLGMVIVLFTFILNKYALRVRIYQRKLH